MISTNKSVLALLVILVAISCLAPCYMESGGYDAEWESAGSNPSEVDEYDLDEESAGSYPLVGYEVREYMKPGPSASSGADYDFDVTTNTSEGNEILVQRLVCNGDIKGESMPKARDLNGNDDPLATKHCSEICGGLEIMSNDFIIRPDGDAWMKICCCRKIHESNEVNQVNEVLVEELECDGGEIRGQKVPIVTVNGRYNPFAVTDCSNICGGLGIMSIEFIISPHDDAWMKNCCCRMISDSNEVLVEELECDGGEIRGQKVPTVMVNGRDDPLAVTHCSNICGRLGPMSNEFIISPHDDAWMKNCCCRMIPEINEVLVQRLECDGGEIRGQLVPKVRRNGNEDPFATEHCSEICGGLERMSNEFWIGLYGDFWMKNCCCNKASENPSSNVATSSNTPEGSEVMVKPLQCNDGAITLQSVSDRDPQVDETIDYQQMSHCSEICGYAERLNNEFTIIILGSLWKACCCKRL